MAGGRGTDRRRRRPLRRARSGLDRIPAPSLREAGQAPSLLGLAEQEGVHDRSVRAPSRPGRGPAPDRPCGVASHSLAARRRALPLQAPAPGAIALTQEMAALELARSRAIANHDAGFLDRLYSDDFKGVAGNGAEVDKPALFALFDRVDAGVSFVSDRFSVTPVGPLGAAVRGRLTGRGPNGRIVSQAVFLHVYERIGCSWRMVTGQTTPIPEGSRGD